MNFLQLHVNRYLIYFILIIGAFQILKFIWWLLHQIYYFFLMREYNLFKRYGGGYAIILGSTEGIGLQYCYEFAKRGFHLVMVSRSLEKLERRKQEILVKYPKINIKVLEANLVKINNSELLKKIEDITVDIDISVIVANVGPGRFIDFNKLEFSDIDNIIQGNIYCHTYICRSLIPKLIKRQRRSAIIFMSSSFESGTVPYCNVYASAKSYMKTLAKSLHLEYSNKIDFLSISLGEIKSEKYPSIDPCVQNPTKLPAQQLRFLGKIIVTTGNLIYSLSNYSIDSYKKMATFVGEEIKKLDTYISKKQN